MSNTSPTEFRTLFSEMVSRPDEDVDLARAALYVSGMEYPELDVDHYLGILDFLAEGASQYIGEGRDIRGTIQYLSEFLFVQQGFHGNDGDYYDPHNSYLNEVLERRTAIPITLSLVYMEVARRLGLVFEGIGLPGHFVIRTGPPEEELYVDAYNGGQLISRGDCERRVHDVSNGRIEFRAEFLSPYPKKVFLIRLLTNLKHCHFRLEDYPRAVYAADVIAIIDPALGSNLKERAWLHYAQKQYRFAIRDLESYLEVTPEAEDAEEVKRQVQGIRSILRTIN